MNKGVVLSLCDRTGVMVQPWHEAGYECWIVDVQHAPGLTRFTDLESTYPSGAAFCKVGVDIRDFHPLDYGDQCRPVIVFAFPPCTDLAVSGAKHFKNKGLEALHDALGVVIACKRICEWSQAPWMLENPIGTLSTYWREPDFIFHPWQYARYLADVKQDAYTKKTCLWTGGGFVIPDMKPASFLDDADRIHKMARTKDRGDKRAVTPRGFARAVFEANQLAILAPTE